MIAPMFAMTHIHFHAGFTNTQTTAIWQRLDCGLDVKPST